ncbi:MAG TPA: transglutaminaseTgpA domain-containing protein [Ilumatobacteraceae bacterium]
MTATRRPLDRDLVATLALCAYSVAVAAGFARVFRGWEFLSDLVVLAVAGHAISFVLRRARVSAFVAVPAMTVLLVCIVCWQAYPDTLRWFLPTSETWDLFRTETDLVRELFPTAVAPVPDNAGWAVLAALAMVVVIILADTFAFRAEARAEALVPGGVLFVFVAAVGSNRLRVTLTVLLIATGILAVIALRHLYETGRRVEVVATARSHGRLVPAAVGTAAAVAVMAGFIGPRIPGANADPWFDTRGRAGGVTEVPSPLVDLRDRLVNQRATEMFRVTATERSYWRITTLAHFDGNTFSIPDRPLERVEGEFGASRPGAAEIRQDITIQGLGGQMVPAAAEPTAAEPTQGDRDDLRWNADIATLLKVGDELENGDTFTIVSASPRVAALQLRLSESDSPPDRIYLELPSDFPESIRQQALEVTAGTQGSFDAALALQNWFRSGFEYSTDLQDGADLSAMEAFVRDRVGFCVQFAATFAAMGRSLDIPTRVAVGYTYGTQLPDGSYSVLGKNYHAWPEVWFDDVGWVMFEPTPGRGAPGTEQYTGVAPEQDGTPVAPDDGEAGAPTTTTPATPGSTPNAPTAQDELPDFSGEFPGIAQDAVDRSEPRDWRPFIAVAVIVLLLVLPAIVRRVKRRLERLNPPEQRVVDAWARATRAARSVGVPGRASMTPHEWARATAGAIPVAARPMTELATTVEAVAFAPPGRIDVGSTGPYGTSIARECSAWSHQIEEIAQDTYSTRERVVRYFTVFD